MSIKPLDILSKYYGYTSFRKGQEEKVFIKIKVRSIQMSIKPLDILSKYYGYTSFRKGQEDIINSIVSGKDVLAIMPTGGGKSICYQVPSLCIDGLTIVISPLISLMKFA